MPYYELIESIIKKKVEKKPYKGRHIGDAVFKMIVEMAYEMKYANRHCEAERTNKFHGAFRKFSALKTELPFDTGYKKYNELCIGDIVVIQHVPFTFPYATNIRIAKVIRINKVSVSLANCNQDGQLIQYNPEEDTYFDTKVSRKNYNKIFTRNLGGPVNVIIITGTKHLRYHGWDS